MHTQRRASWPVGISSFIHLGSSAEPQSWTSDWSSLGHMSIADPIHEATREMKEEILLGNSEGQPPGGSVLREIWGHRDRPHTSHIPRSPTGGWPVSHRGLSLANQPARWVLLGTAEPTAHAHLPAFLFAAAQPAEEEAASSRLSAQEEGGRKRSEKVRKGEREADSHSGESWARPDAGGELPTVLGVKSNPSPLTGPACPSPCSPQPPGFALLGQLPRHCPCHTSSLWPSPPHLSGVRIHTPSWSQSAVPHRRGNLEGDTLCLLPLHCPPPFARPFPETGSSS